MSPVLKVFVQVFLQGAKFERSEWCNWAKRNSEGSERRLISMKTYMSEARKQLSSAMKHPLFSWILDLPLGLCESRHTRTSRQYAERNKTHPLLSYMSSRC